MKNILLKYTCFALLVFATVLAFLVDAYAKEIKMQESSYAPVMITKSFDAVREHDVAEKSEVMSNATCHYLKNGMTCLGEQIQMPRCPAVNRCLSVRLQI